MNIPKVPFPSPIAARYAQKDIYGMAVTNLSITRKYDPAIQNAVIARTLFE